MNKDICTGSPWNGPIIEVRRDLKLVGRLKTLEGATGLSSRGHRELRKVRAQLGIGKSMYACAQEGRR